MDAASAELLPLPGGPALVRWRRSARARRVSLRIDPREGMVVVTLPPRASRRAGLSLLMDHADWVAARLAALPGPLSFADGADIPLAGVPRRIRHIPAGDGAGRGSVWVEGDEIRVTGDIAFLPRRLRDFLRQEAKRRLTLMVREKMAMLPPAPHRALKRVAVKDTSSRWGSCAPDGTLSFSWRLVLAPSFVQDYVAAHEVAHLSEMNHGPKFWALTHRLSPHGKTATAWLHEHGARLLRVG